MIAKLMNTEILIVSMYVSIYISSRNLSICPIMRHISSKSYSTVHVSLEAGDWSTPNFQYNIFSMMKN